MTRQHQAATAAAATAANAQARAGVPADPPTDLVSTRAAAERASVVERTILRAIADGQLTVYRFAGRRMVRVSMADVEALIVPVGAGRRDADR